MRRQLAAVVSGVLLALASRPTAPAVAVSVPVAGRPLELTGWALLRQTIKTDDATPSERTLQQLWLRSKYAPVRWLSLDATINFQNGGPATKQTRSGLYSYRAVFQSISPAVIFEEAFAEIAFGATELRVGLQKFAWGKLDRVQAVDVLNVERFSDPFLLDEDERKIGVPAIQGAQYLPAAAWVPEEARLTIAWIPQYFPYWFPLPGERWYPPAGTPPATFSVPALTTSVPVGFRVVNSPAPGFQLGNSGYAARASAFTAGVDYALYYYHGFDNRPAFRLTAEAAGAPLPVPPFVTDVSATTRLSPVFRKIDLWGTDAAYAWGDFTFRAELAFVSGRPFSRDIRFLVSSPRQLAPAIEAALREIARGNSPTPVALPPAFAVRSAFEWGVAVDYTWSDTTFLLQLNQTDVLHNHVDLLIQNVDTVLTANVSRAFLHEDLTLQLTALQGIESSYTMLMPRVTYRILEQLEARLGYLFIAGRQQSVVGQYKDNDEVFLSLRYLL